MTEVTHYLLLEDSNVVGTEKIEADPSFVPADNMFCVPSTIYDLVQERIELGYYFRVIGGDVVEAGRDLDILKRNAFLFLNGLYDKYSNALRLGDIYIILDDSELCLINLCHTTSVDFTLVRGHNVYTVPSNNLFEVIQQFLMVKNNLTDIYKICLSNIQDSDNPDVVFQQANQGFKQYLENTLSIKIEQELL